MIPCEMPSDQPYGAVQRYLTSGAVLDDRGTI